MENGQHPDAMQIILTRARSHLAQGKYPQVIVFSKTVMDLDKLKRAFKGHSYRHKGGHVWMLTRRCDVQALLEQMGDKVSETGFETQIKEALNERE